jgi:hypothetical protein
LSPLTTRRAAVILTRYCLLKGRRTTDRPLANQRPAYNSQSAQSICEVPGYKYRQSQHQSVLDASLIYVYNGPVYSTHHSATVSKESPAISKISTNRPGSAPANSQHSAGRPHRGVNIRTETASYVGARVHQSTSTHPHITNKIGLDENAGKTRLKQ